MIKVILFVEIKLCATGSSDGAYDPKNPGLWCFLADSQLVLFVSAERNGCCREGFFSDNG